MSEKKPGVTNHRSLKYMLVTLVGILIAGAAGFSACAKASPDSTPGTTQEQTPLLYQASSSDPTLTPASTAFQITDLTISPTKVNPGDRVTITATLTNTGFTEATYILKLYINNSIKIDAETIVPAGASKELRFSGAERIPGTYVVTLGDRTDQFVVAEPSTLIVGPDALILEPDDPTKPSNLKSTLAPNFNGVDVVTNEAISLAQLKGYTVILNFVNYGCSESVNEIVSAQLFAIKELREQRDDFIPLSVFCGCCPEYTLRNFAVENDFNWPWLLDVENSIVPQYIDHLREHGYPTLVFIDKDQQIRTVTGYTDTAGLRTRLNEISTVNTN